MKNIIIYILLIFVFVSCDLDDIEPQQNIPLEAAFADDTAIGFALTGMYDAYQDDDVGATFVQLSSDLMANNDIIFSGSFTSLQEIRAKNIATSNVQASATWIDSYETINAANAIIDALDANPDNFDPSVLGSARGQALAMRAYVTFELVRLYGETPFLPGSAIASNTQMGVPYITEPVLSSAEINSPERDDVATVYQNVIDDLTEAITLMQANGGGGQGEIDAFVAQAMLYRVYLQMGDYDEVLAITDAIINSSAFSLVPNLADFYADEGEFGSESIFEVSNLPDDGPPGQTLTDFYNVDGRDDISVSGEYLALSAALFNTRQETLYTTNGYTISDDRFNTVVMGNKVFKYEDATNEADNTPIFRYAETLLSNAEARVRVNGMDPVALQHLNTVRARGIKILDSNGLPVAGAADYEMTDFADAQELLDAILLERRVEIAFEGYGYHDRTRLQLPIDGVPFGSGNLAWPIPQREIDVNTNLMQNPFYL